MIPTLALPSGARIPQIGLGFWQVPQEGAARVTADGLTAGYRLIDTAQGYGNEAGIGAALAEVPREKVFVTSKLRNAAHAPDDARRAFDRSMADLGLEVIDLFLIHWPRPAQDRFVEAWRVLVDLQAEGRIRDIGVSNFTETHLQRLADETGVVPAVNQVELHPRFQQRPLRAAHARLGIVTESWSPLGQGNLLGDPVIGAIAARRGRTPAQVILRWHLQEGLVAIPKTVRPARMAENIDLGFTLTAADMAEIAALDDPGGRIGPDPARAEFSF